MPERCAAVTAAVNGFRNPTSVSVFKKRQSRCSSHTPRMGSCKSKLPVPPPDAVLLEASKPYYLLSKPLRSLVDFGAHTTVVRLHVTWAKVFALFSVEGTDRRCAMNARAVFDVQPRDPDFCHELIRLIVGVAGRIGPAPVKAVTDNKQKTTADADYVALVQGDTLCEKSGCACFPAFLGWMWLLAIATPEVLSAVYYRLRVDPLTPSRVDSPEMLESMVKAMIGEEGFGTDSSFDRKMLVHHRALCDFALSSSTACDEGRRFVTEARFVELMREFSMPRVLAMQAMIRSAFGPGYWLERRLWEAEKQYNSLVFRATLLNVLRCQCGCLTGPGGVCALPTTLDWHADSKDLPGVKRASLTRSSLGLLSTDAADAASNPVSMRHSAQTPQSPGVTSFPCDTPSSMKQGHSKQSKIAPLPPMTLKDSSLASNQGHCWSPAPQGPKPAAMTVREFKAAKSMRNAKTAESPMHTMGVEASAMELCGPSSTPTASAARDTVISVPAGGKAAPISQSIPATGGSNVPRMGSQPNSTSSCDYSEADVHSDSAAVATSEHGGLGAAQTGTVPQPQGSPTTSPLNNLQEGPPLDCSPKPCSNQCRTTSTLQYLFQLEDLKPAPLFVKPLKHKASRVGLQPLQPLQGRKLSADSALGSGLVGRQGHLGTKSMAVLKAKPLLVACKSTAEAAGSIQSQTPAYAQGANGESSTRGSKSRSKYVLPVTAAGGPPKQYHKAVACPPSFAYPTIV